MKIESNKYSIDEILRYVNSDAMPTLVKCSLLRRGLVEQEFNEVYRFLTKGIESPIDAELIIKIPGYLNFHTIEPYIEDKKIS